MTDGEFTRFQRLIHQEIGIHVSEAKRALLVSRLTRHLRRLELETFEAYFQVATASPDETQLFIDSICTNETRFFREPRQFELMRDVCIPAWRRAADEGLRARTIRIWSAGCSTGDEPYSLAMLLGDLLPAHEGWDVKIIATDVSSKALAVAREGVWPIGRSKDIPFDYLRRFMLQGVRSRSGVIKAGPEIRELITFGSLNLAGEHFPVAMNLDAVFCRNVMIYLENQVRATVVQRLFQHLASGGYLFLGHAETLNGIHPAAKAGIPNTYVK